MKLKNKLTQSELKLLMKIGIQITDREYILDEIIDIADDTTLNGEITAIEDGKSDLAIQYSDLVDKLINLEDEVE